MQYPNVINKQIDTIQQTALLQLDIPTDLIYFEGHFTDFPLLPGVIQLGWAIHFAKDVLAIKNNILHIEQIKFTHVISPGDRVTLELKHQPTILYFNYYKNKTPCSGGKIKLEPAYE